MARIDSSDFSQARMAPESVMRDLEALDPSACLVHLGGTRWIVGKVRPSSLARAQAEAMLDHWNRAVRNGATLSEQGRQRVRFAQLGLLGFRPVEQYRIVGTPDGRIVQDFARSRHAWLTAGVDAPLRNAEAVTEERRAEAQREVGSIDRAKEAWKYAFTRSHRVGTSLTPVERPKAGWTRVTPSVPA